MQLAIDHVTLYRYETPVRGVVQSLRLTPSRFEGQQVVDWSVTVSDGTEGAAFRDGAGDWVQAFTVAGPVSEIEVRVQGTVETSDLSGVLRRHREIVAPEAYLRETDATLPDTAIVEIARAAAAEAGAGGGEVGGETGGDRVAAAHALMNAVADAIAYEPGATHAATTAAEALRLGKGVCQDHAQVMIAAARTLGIPARYVSGYLFSEAGPDEQEAAHAWAELYAPGLGWIGFDAANRWCPDERYVRLGSGLDAASAAPIRGTSRLGPADIHRESLQVSLDVQAVATESGQQ